MGNYMASSPASKKCSRLKPWGVFFVPRPPTRTQASKMQLIYNNFDGLDITFQGALPEKILNKLSSAKAQAQNEKRSVLMELGSENMSVMVAETGASGGYRYRFDTGMDGEVWFIAHSTNSEGYNIRVSAKSLALALHGYEGVKERILNRFKILEAMGQGRHDDTGKVINTPLERISRFDYCFDFIMDADFKPTPDRFDVATLFRTENI